MDEARKKLLGEKQPSQAFVETDQLGALAVFLSSPAADQMTGVTLPMDGGWTAVTLKTRNAYACFSLLGPRLAEAEAAAARGEVPVGAVVVAPGGIFWRRQVIGRKNWPMPPPMPELLALRDAASALGSPRLIGCDLYVTLEPCPMCAGAISHFRLRRVYFAVYDPKGGAVEHGARWFEQPTCLHRPDVYGGFHEQAAAEQLRRFFAERR